MQIILIVTFILTMTYARTHAQDYRIYHKIINNAERCFFFEGKPDSALAYYDSAFDKFKFVYAKDCYMACQAAFYINDNRYVSYLKKGFSVGLQMKDLCMSEILKPLIADTVAFKKKFPEYKTLRKQYLDGIKIHMLAHVMDEVVADQQEKNAPSYIYAPKITRRAYAIRDYIRAVGFPGDSQIGLSQIDIMKELGQEHPDYPWGRSNPTDYMGVAQLHIFTILVHYPCFYDLLTQSEWLNYISKGQIHPCEVAMIYDNKYRFIPADGPKFADWFFCKYGEWGVSYKKNAFCGYCEGYSNRRATDSMRVALYINPLVVDSARNAFCEKRGFFFESGFFDCR